MTNSPEVLENIKQTTIKAHLGQIVEQKVEPNHFYLLRDADGSVKKIRAEPPLMHAKCFDFASVIQMVERIAKPQTDDQGKIIGRVPASVWYSTSGLIVPFGDGRDKATLSLSFSKPFAKLIEWDKGAEVKHDEFKRLLRTLFADSLDAHPNLSDDVAVINFQTIKDARSEIQNKRVSMGRDIMAKAGGADKLPNELLFDVPVFKEPIVPFSTKIRVSADLNPLTECFEFECVSGEIEKAKADAEAFIYRKLLATIGDEEAITKFLEFNGIYNGTP